jgi:MBG domain (YGX type)/WD40-like Beta Propeller Repeat
MVLRREGVCATDLHPYLSTDGRTLVFASGRPGGQGTDLYMTTRAAKLTVTANNQGRLFGQANPPLAYTITGFVGGETSAVVSGSAACTTA